MSTPINDGGPAFPEYHYFDEGRGAHGAHMTATDAGCGGMSLRAYMATKFVQGAIANNALQRIADEVLEEKTDMTMDGLPKVVNRLLCRMMCELADALIAQLNEPKA